MNSNLESRQGWPPSSPAGSSASSYLIQPQNVTSSYKPEKIFSSILLVISRLHLIHLNLRGELKIPPVGKKSAPNGGHSMCDVLQVKELFGILLTDQDGEQVGCGGIGMQEPEG